MRPQHRERLAHPRASLVLVRGARERRQPGEVPVDEHRRAPLAERGELGERDLGEIEGDGDRLGAEIAARAPWVWERRAGFVAAMSGVASGALIVAGLARRNVWLALAAILSAHLTSGMIGPMLTSWYNELIEGDSRATLVSFQTTLMTLGGAVGQPV